MNNTPHNHRAPSRIGLSARRRDAVRHLLNRHQFKESLALSRQPSLFHATMTGLQAVITLLIALPIVYISSWSHLIGFAALGTLVALFGRFAPRARRKMILFQAGLCQVLVVFVISAAAWLGAPEYLQLTLVALLCGVLMFICVTGEFGAPGPLIFVFAAGASVTSDITLNEVVQRTLITASVCALAWCVCAATMALRHLPDQDRSFPTEAQRPLGHRLIASARSTIGAGIAIFVARYALDAAHSTWAAMGALAVLQGGHLHISMNRALQRMAGTVVGAVLAWGLLQHTPSIWTLISILALLQLLTEVIIGTNYALGQILVTPMALLMTSMGTVQAVGMEMVPERVFDTLVGASIGIGMAVLLSTLDDRQYLAKLRQPSAHLDSEMA